jgi:hypothetical protein
MVAWAGARTVALGVFVGSLLVGCMVDAQSGSGGSSGGSFGSAGSGSSSGSSSGGSSTQPMLVVVDPNRTMSASPGDGVGVFTQYASGGHWNIWWTCDTNKTGESCAFDITVSVAGATTIANVVGQGISLTSTGASGLTQSSQLLEATTTTTTSVQGVTFDTVSSTGVVPVITVDAKLSGQEDGSYFFFVQDDAINGNYQGTLSDPLMLEPQSP